MCFHDFSLYTAQVWFRFSVTAIFFLNFCAIEKLMHSGHALIDLVYLTI